jgi:peptidoglycan/xylan/chitin deacetylase (PgdA/CDA1 family)
MMNHFSLKVFGFFIFCFLFTLPAYADDSGIDDAFAESPKTVGTDYAEETNDTAFQSPPSALLPQDEEPTEDNSKEEPNEDVESEEDASDQDGDSIVADADFGVVKPVPLPKPTPLPNPGGNLVPNASLENTGAGGVPQNWNRGGWGNNTAILTYPALGRIGKGAKVQVTDYTDGDAKWYFDEVEIEGSGEYTYSNYYTADTPAIVNAQFRLSNGEYSYVYFGATEATGSWKKFENSFTAPPNATHVTVFHLLNSVGTLTIDDVSLTKGASGAFPNGMVSLTFDDGWNSHYVNALPILNEANMKASFYIISDEMLAAPSGTEGGNIIANGSLEVNENGAPINWFSNIWGNNTANFSYPVTGVDSSQAAKVQVTRYTDGDAKWVFAEVPVESGGTYLYSDMYKSNVSTDIDIQYKTTSGSYTYDQIATVPAANTWTRYETEITIPNGVVAVSIFHSLVSEGELTIDDISLVPTGNTGSPPINLQGYMDPQKIIDIENQGHEIGSHTLNHPSLISISETEAKRQIEKSKADLLSAGIKAIDSFVYPYGDYNEYVVSWVKNAGYSAARSVIRGYNRKDTDPYIIQIQQIDRQTTRAQVQEWISAAKKNNTWLVLMFHQIDDTSEFYGNSPTLLRQITSDISNAGLRVVTLRDGAEMLD